MRLLAPYNKNDSFQKKFMTIFINIWLLVALSNLILVLLGHAVLIGESATHQVFILWEKLGKLFLPTLILTLSILVVILSNPVYALVCLILVFFSTSLVLLSLNVSFLAIIYLIIYIGAIAILFLFVIMMFNLRELQKKSDEMNDYTFIAVHFQIYLWIIIKFYYLFKDYVWTYLEKDPYFNNDFLFKAQDLNYYLAYQNIDALVFGTLLYNYYCYLFLVAALVLLTAMLGSIVLALSTTEKTIKNF